MTVDEELALVARAQGGERAAVGELWDAITPKLYGYLVNTLRDQTIAEDILQETWLKAIGALPRFRARGVRFSAWLFAIARNECRGAWRSAKREQPTELPEDEVAPRSTESAEKLENTLFVENIFKKLSEPDQEILRLRYIADLSFKEVATVLNISALAARVRVHRALARANAVIEK